MELVLSKKFNRQLKRFLRKSPDYKKKLEKTLNLLLKNPQHPSLRLHKLAGFNIYSISVDMRIRIIVHFQKNTVFLLKIGNHDEVY